MKPDFPSLADEIAEPRPDMNIEVAAFTVSETSINTPASFNKAMSLLLDGCANCLCSFSNTFCLSASLMLSSFTAQTASTGMFSV